MRMTSQIKTLNRLKKTGRHSREKTKTEMTTPGMPRFRIRDRVVIGGSTTTRYLGKEGVIIEARPAGTRALLGDTKLDRYLVQFSPADWHWFFDTQLSTAPPAGGRGPP